MLRLKSALIMAVSLFSGHQALANEMALEIGSTHLGFNTAYVSVKICEPKTQRCRVIDKIKLDTGSDGLRIKASALAGLKLDPGPRESRNLRLCAEMGGGTGYFGPLATADVWLGDELAERAQFQVVQDDATKPPGLCRNQAEDGRNGILGIAAVNASPNGKKFFRCEGKKCFQLFSEPNLVPKNIVSLFKRNNNGFIVRIPQVSSSGQNSATGKIIFGIGTEANNQPNLQAKTCKASPGSFFKIRYKGREFHSSLDTGSFANLIPFSVSKEARCDATANYLCPKSKSEYDVEMLNDDGSVCDVETIKVKKHPIGDMTMNQQLWVVPDLAVAWTSAQNVEMFLFGLPSFFGRDVYFVVEGQDSALGRGPLVGFGDAN